MTDINESDFALAKISAEREKEKNKKEPSELQKRCIAESIARNYPGDIVAQNTFRMAEGLPPLAEGSDGKGDWKAFCEWDKLPNEEKSKYKDEQEYKEKHELELKEKELSEVLHMMYTEIIGVLKEYLDMPEGHYKIIALWIIGTYFHEDFNTYPYLFFNAMRGSGKTRTLRLISYLSANSDGSIQNNLTEAVLFRTPRNTTTCIDEIEQISNKEKQTLRELLNSAYKKGMKVKRMKKVKAGGQEMQVAEEFEPYFPIAMANISGMGEVLADRAITLILEKSVNQLVTNKVENFDQNSKIKWLKLTLSEFGVDGVVVKSKKHLEKWNYFVKFKHNYTNNINNTNNTTYINYTNKHIKRYLDNVKECVFALEPSEVEFFEKLNGAGIVGRNFELFMPLMEIAQLIGKDIFDDTFELMKDYAKEKKAEEYNESKDVLLYQFVVSKQDNTEFIPIKELVREFRSYVGEGDEEDKWLNDKWLGRALKRLNLVLDKRRMRYGMEVTLNFLKAKEKLRIFL